jgi:hypothetical protein
MWRGLAECNVEEATLAGLKAWLRAKRGFSLHPTDRPLCRAAERQQRWRAWRTASIADLPGL